MSPEIEISNLFIGIYKAVNCWKRKDSVKYKGFHNFKGL